MNRSSRLVLWILCAAIAATAGCASSAWRQALKEDAPAGYYRFLRDHPDSEYAESAKARLEYHKVKRRPTLEGLFAFRDAYPNEVELIEALRPLLEEKAFDRARAAGSAEAYDDFLAEFPNGELAARAEGNAAYLRAGGFGGDPAALARFAQEHPASDYAAEAARSAEIPAVRAETEFDRVALQIQIAPATPEADRLSKEFTDRAIKAYQQAGVELVAPSGLQTASASSVPRARLTIAHGERSVQTEISGGDFTRPGVEAVTMVSLRLGADGPPIWEREFSVRADLRDHLDGTSLLFGPVASRYWSQFFVPVATWQSKASLRSILNLAKPPVAVDADGDRAVVLYGDGDFQIVDLSDPTRPVVLAEHERPRDLRKWNGVRLLGDRVAVFGPDGLEIVRFDGQAMETLVSHERGTIGAVVAVEPVGEGLVLASNRGLMISERDGATPMRVLRRDIEGMAASGEMLLFTDGESLFAATLPLLRQNRVLSQLRIGRAFDPGRVRSFGKRAVVIGETGTLVVDLTDPQKPQVVSQLLDEEVGEVRDAAAVDGRIFLLGQRGLLALDGTDQEVGDSVDLSSSDRLSAMGRHVVAVGGQQLEVVDTTPFRIAGGAAQVAPAP